MVSKLKFLVFASASLLAVPIVAFGSGGVPDCTSVEVKKALDNHHRLHIKESAQMGLLITLSDFKTLSKSDKLSECQCTLSVKFMGESKATRANFSVERNGYGEILIDTDDIVGVLDRALLGQL